MVCEGACGVRGCMWCARVHVVCEGACDVRGCMWCARVHVVCEGACGVRGCTDFYTLDRCLLPLAALRERRSSLQRSQAQKRYS